MPAIDAPFPKVSLQEDGSALQIGSALALFTSGQAGRGHGSHTHPIRHSFRPPTNAQPPTIPSEKKPLLAQVAPIVATAEAAQRSPRLTPQSRHTQWGLCSSSKAWGGSGSRGGDRQL